jgi:hypothetical protein
MPGRAEPSYPGSGDRGVSEATQGDAGSDDYGPGDTGSYRAAYHRFSARAETAFAGQPAAERGDET